MLILALGAGIRLYNIDAGCFWVDEANTYHIAKEPLSAIAGKLSNDSNPPLYYFILHIWMKLFGTGAACLRLPSVLFSMGLMCVVFIAGRRCFSPQVGLWGAFIIATSPLQIFYSQSARMYTLLPLLATLSVFWLARYLDTVQVRYLIGYSTVTLLAVLTHNFALFLLPLHGFLIMYAGMSWRRLRVWIIVFTALGLLYIPWLNTFMVQLTSPDIYVWFEDVWQRRSFFLPVYLTLLSFSPGGGHLPYPGLEPIPYPKLPAVLFAALALAGFVAAVRDRRGEAMPGYLWVSSFLIIPAVCSIGVSYLLIPHFVSGRVDQMMFPAYALLVALGISAVRSRTVRALFSASAACLALYSVVTFHPDYKAGGLNGNDRDLAKALISTMQPGDAVLCTSLSRATLQYYIEAEGAGAALLSFPRSTAMHLGGQDDKSLLENGVNLRSEADIVLKQAQAACGPRGRLFIVFVQSPVNDALREVLGTSGSLKPVQDYGAFKQCGLNLTVTLTAYHSGDSAGM